MGVEEETGLDRRLCERAEDFFGGVAVAEGIRRPGRLRGLFTREPSRSARDDFFRGSADELGPAGFDGFRTFRNFPHDEHARANGRRLFLHTARVRKNERGALHQVDKLRIGKRIDEEDALAIA